MGRKSNNVMQYVVSFRVNREEKEALNLLAQEAGVSLSNLVRENLNLSEEAEARMRCVSA